MADLIEVESLRHRLGGSMARYSRDLRFRDLQTTEPTPPQVIAGRSEMMRIWLFTTHIQVFLLGFCGN
jgi:hypothetical protein